MSNRSANGASPPVIRIVDDDRSVRDALTDLFETLGMTTAAYASVVDFLANDLPDAPGCLVLDVRMPGQGGLEFQADLARQGNPLPIVFITGHGDVPMAMRAVKAGASDFLLKPFDNQELIDAVNAALRRDAAARAADARQDSLTDRFASLTAGERAVIDGVVEGLLNKQIADRLGVSEVTVKVRRAHALRKLDVTSVPALVRLYDRAWPSG
ncbi:response regulator [Sphingomonadaceae bacterium jetA1]|jgi:FixJ family two-component response regulator|uniref:response regulator transcription factor n=1 Tax=Facivitalis istanbulensis TaxID=3075838 RepID=UPI00347E29BC